ncbi:hypothetical protein V496_02308 [Pseudogymnoascus sp. VKM F-4515 (FW-2607)]|nr:hypothetical protein V496_02308 [Pseudogymnoascus sp. VKM F-4515 (FW-2607)]
MPSIPSILALVASFAVTVTANPASHSPFKNKNFVVDAHRGALGHRTENTLWAFAYSMELGADRMEIDVIFTKDEVPIVWHDPSILATKCDGEHVGKLVKDLTLAQVKSLNCAKQLTNHYGALLHPVTHIPTLEEFLDLVNCYGNKKAIINLELKLSPTAPEQFLPREKYINNVIPVFEKKGLMDLTIVQSFDWPTVDAIKKKWPKTTIICLVGTSQVIPEADGSFPWLGLNLDSDFNGDWVAAAKFIGCSGVTPSHGSPGTRTPNSPDYVPFVTKEIVDRAHNLGMTVIPYTVDHAVTVDKLIDMGVDGVITNYPEMAMAIAKKRGLKTGHKGSRAHPECLANA